MVPLASSSAGRLSEMRALRRWLGTREADDVVISMMTRANFQTLMLRRRGGPRLVISERNIPRREPGQGGLHLLVRNSLFRWLYPRADSFVAISHPVASYFYGVGRVDPSRIWVIPNPATGKTGSAESDVDIKPRRGHLKVVVPGRLVDAKRPLLALDICDELARRGVAVSLHYFGEGDMRSDLEGQVKSYPVSIRGRVERWFEELDGESVVLLPSAVEGFGNVLLEASAVGVPVVVGSNTYGSADAVIPGVTGFFARGDTVEDFADAVQASCQLSSAVPEGWLDQFSTENSVLALSRCIAHVGGRRSPQDIGTVTAERVGAPR